MTIRGVLPLVIGLLAGAGAMRAWSISRPPSAPFQMPGGILPAIPLETATGAATDLGRALQGRPTLVVVQTPDDCLTCATIGLDFKILRDHVPGLATLVVLAGNNDGVFREYIQKERLQQVAFIDRTGRIFAELGVTPGTLALLVGGDGRVLQSDLRRGAAAKVFSFSRIVPQLAQALASPAIDTIPR